MTDAARFTHFHRLEPQVRSSGGGGQLDEALEAQVADPLFLLARQWQMAEFHGEDGGSPVLVTIKTAGVPVDRFRPGDDGPSLPYPPGVPVEYLAEAGGPPELTLRAAARAGVRFLSLLAPLPAGVRDDVTRQVIKRCPLVRADDPEAAAEHPLDPAGVALGRVLKNRAPHGGSLAKELAANWRPDGLSAGHAAHFDNAADRWQEWFAATHATPGPTTWVRERLEHRFGVEAAVGNRRVVLTAPEYPGGSADPYRFDLDAGDTPLVLPGEAPAAAGTSRVTLPTRAMYPGMPADRWWEFEDTTVNVPAIEAGPTDLARLLVVEFANVYGNDHWIVPVELEVGKLHWITRLTVRDTFDETWDIAPVTHERLALFRLSDARDDKGAPGPPLLPLLPQAAGRMEGAAVEEVLFVRDEMANLGWAVERVVRSATGRPRPRADEFPLDEDPGPSQLPGAVLDYRLLTPVPPHWIPLVPVPLVPGQAGDQNGTRGAIRFRRGVIPRHGGLRPGAVGRLLEPEVKPVYFRDEEIPRSGVTASRVPVAARDREGRLYHWVGRRVRAGKGEAAGGLAFDAALPAKDGRP
ncbi:hypothetical protein ACH44C_02645 [Streptomyces purpureus]|uniref:hypothetical protein n=1 Tax=Streptomyces purpureus TaxID=1951 RepID=UPI00379A6950